MFALQLSCLSAEPENENDEQPVMAAVMAAASAIAGKTDNLARSIRDTFLNQGNFIISADPHDDLADAGPELEVRAFLVDAAHHGGRLDHALAALVPEFSRNYLQQLIEAGAVMVNRLPATR